jgi:hypothetical protein
MEKNLRILLMVLRKKSGTIRSLDQKHNIFRSNTFTPT